MEDQLSVDEETLILEMFKSHYARLKQMDCDYDFFYWSLSLLHSAAKKMGLALNFVHEAHSAEEVTRIVKIKASREKEINETLQKM